MFPSPLSWISFLAYTRASFSVLNTLYFRKTQPLILILKFSLLQKSEVTILLNITLALHTSINIKIRTLTTMFVDATIKYDKPGNPLSTLKKSPQHSTKQMGQNILQFYIYIFSVCKEKQFLLILHY